MKRTVARSDYHLASVDRSPRTLHEIQSGPPKRKPAPYQPGLYGPKPNLKSTTIPSDRDLELAKQQAAKFLPNAKSAATGSKRNAHE